jgi:hypothetical protein
MEEIFAFGLRSVRAKWRAIGYPLDEMAPGVFPVDSSLEPEEVAARQIRLLEAGVMGEPNGRPDAAPDVQQIYFDVIANSADPEAVNGQPLTVQWRFDDADPWHVTVAAGRSQAAPGEAPDPDVTLETSWGEWINISKGASDPRRALLRRRLRVRGGPRGLYRFSRTFPRRSNSPSISS